MIFLIGMIVKKYTDDTAVIAVDYSGGGVDLVFEQ